MRHGQYRFIAGFLVIPVVALLGAAAAVVGPGAARRASALRTARLLARS